MCDTNFLDFLLMLIIMFPLLFILKVAFDLNDYNSDKEEVINTDWKLHIDTEFYEQIRYEKLKEEISQIKCNNCKNYKKDTRTKTKLNK